VTALSFSTHEVLPDRRRDFIEERFSALAPLSFDYPNDREIALAVRGRALPGVTLTRAASSPFRCEYVHERASGVDTSAVSGLIFTTGGTCAISQDRRESELSPQMARLCAFDKDYRVRARAPTVSLSIAVPRDALEARVGDVDMLMAMGMPASPVLRLLGGYAEQIVREDGDFPHADAKLFSAHLLDLMSLCLGATGEQAHLARERGARAARFAAITAEIDANLDNPQLSLAWLSRRFRMPERAIRVLFYAQDTNFTDYLLNARLERAHTLLAAPGSAGRTITAVAYEAGFGDLSWFHHAFRRRFGATPGEMRRMDREDPGSS